MVKGKRVHLSWFLEGEVMDQIPDGGHGFVYLITFTNGKRYIGKKNFYAYRNVKQDGSKKKVNLVLESNWKRYNSSMRILDDVKLEVAKKEVLKVVSNKTQLTYWEVYYQFQYNVLLDDSFLNKNILGRFYKNKFLTGQEN
jgi:hypothetical protein